MVNKVPDATVWDWRTTPSLENEPPRRNNGSEFAVPYGVLVVVLAVVAVAALAALVVVAAIQRSDELATVALCLAIVAFIVQVMVFVFQQSTAHEQSMRAEFIFGETKRVLAQVQERTQGTQAAVTRLDERMLDALIAKAARESGEVVTTDRLTHEAQRAVEPLVAPSEGVSTNRWPGPLPQDEARKLFEEMSTYPSTEAERREAVDALKRLNRYALATVWLSAEDLVASTAPDSPVGPGLKAANIKEIPDEWFQRFVGPDGRQLEVLSPEGRRIARVLTAKGPVPRDIAADLPKLRRRYSIARRQITDVARRSS